MHIDGNQGQRILSLCERFRCHTYDDTSVTCAGHRYSDLLKAAARIIDSLPDEFMPLNLR